MKHFSFALVAAALLAGCEDGYAPSQSDESSESSQIAAATTTSRRYSGRAVGAQSTVAGFTAKVVEVVLPWSGGTKSASLPSASIPNVLSAGTLNASVDGRYSRSISTASVGTLKLTHTGNTITATGLSALAKAECYNRRSGSSEITRLVVNGAPVTVTSEPNQTHAVNNGKLIINQQTKVTNSITVTALRLVIDGKADVLVASAQAGIVC